MSAALHRLLITIATVLWIPSCFHLPREEPGRSPSPVDSALLALLRPRHDAWDLRLESAEETDTYERFVFSFQTYCDYLGDFKTVRGDYYRTRLLGETGAPLVVLSPILAGPVDDYLASRYFSAQACGVGLSTYFLHQEEVILDPDRDAADLEARIRDNIRDNIKALELFCGLRDVDPGRLGSLGISLGGIKNVVLIACEPRLTANVLCLAGADLPRILLESRETLVEEYLARRRQRDGLEPQEVAAEFRRWLRSEPLHLAETICNDRVILFLGRFDDKVPYATGLFLREKLGSPEAYILPLGHYSAVLAAPWTAGVAMDWLLERFHASHSCEPP